MVEYKHDPSSGQAKLLEVNGRYWGTIPLAVLAGVDFPLYEWQLAHHEEPVIPSRYHIGVRTRWIVGDIERLYKLVREPQKVSVPTPSRLRELLRFFTDFKLSTHMVPWSVWDPLPAFVECVQSVLMLIVNDSRRLAKRLLGKFLCIGTGEAGGVDA